MKLVVRLDFKGNELEVAVTARNKIKMLLEGNNSSYIMCFEGRERGNQAKPSKKTTYGNLIINLGCWQGLKTGWDGSEVYLLIKSLPIS